MKRFIVCCAIIAVSMPAVGWEHAASAAAARSPASTLPVTAISAKLEALAKYFAADDISAIVAMWAPDGTYTDDSGNIYTGREALRKRFTGSHSSAGNPVVALRPENTRMLSTNVVLSQGTVLRKVAPDKFVPDTRYAMVFTKQGSDWLISSATETTIFTEQEELQQPSINDLSWMIGDWKAEHNGSSLKLHVDWAGNKNFVRWSYQISKPGEPVQDNTELIAFDPKSGTLVSWGFDGTGTFGESTWSKEGDSWELDVVKTAPDGSTLTARNIISPKGSNRFQWQSVARTAGGLPLPDTGELVVERESK